MFSSKNESEVIAKVHSEYLYEEDLKKFYFPNGLSEKDSVSLLTEYIDTWATQQLLVYQAKQNMATKRQEEFEYMVKKYENELYASAYENVYVQQNLNTLVNNEELEAYYDEHKGGFLLKDNLLKVRYIKVPLNYKDITATKKIIGRYNEEDTEEIDKMLPGFLTSFLNEDEKWFTYQDLVEKIPELSNIEESKVLNTNNVLVFSDQEGKYLFKTIELLKAGKIAPIEFVSDDIKKIIVNKRKLELQKKLEKEILKDALQANDYTIFQ